MPVVILLLSYFLQAHSLHACCNFITLLLSSGTLFTCLLSFYYSLTFFRHTLYMPVVILLLSYFLQAHSLHACCHFITLLLSSGIPFTCLLSFYYSLTFFRHTLYMPVVILLLSYFLQAHSLHACCHFIT